LHCDDSIAGVDIGNGYHIEKRYLENIPYKNKLTDGDGKLTIDYLGSQLHDDDGVYFMCIHKEDSYEITPPQLKPGIILTDKDMMCGEQLEAYKDRETNYLHRQFSLLHLFKAGNIGYVQLYFVHNFSVMGGFINNKMNQTDNCVTKNTIEETTFTLLPDEVNECNRFLSDTTEEEYLLLKPSIDEFVWGLDQVDNPTGFEQYTTALEMTMLATGQQGKKEALSKRVSVLLETDTIKITALYNKMKSFYRYRSESLHEGNGDGITPVELKDLEGIVRRVLYNYLAFCKSSLASNNAITWDEIKSSKISALKAQVDAAKTAGVLPV
jgi:hypothetical protein